MKKYLILWLFMLSCFCIHADNFDIELIKFECSDSIVQPGDFITLSVSQFISTDSTFYIRNGLQFYLSSDTIIDEKDIKFCTNHHFSEEEACFWFNQPSDKLPMRYFDGFTVPCPYDMSIENHYIIAFSDCTNKYAETNENNNIKYCPIKIKGSANNDFYIKNISLDNINLDPYEEFSFSFDNYYKGDSEYDIYPILNFMYSRDSIWGNEVDDDTIYIYSWEGANFNHTDTIQQIDWTLKLKEGLQGDYHLLIKTDWDDRFKEVNDNNNVSGFKIHVNEEVNDFRINKVTCDFDDLQPGQVANITNDVSYIGNNKSKLATTVKCYLSKDSLIDESDYLFSLDHLQYSFENGIPSYPGKLQILIPEQIASGEYFLISKIIPSESIIENDTTNNTNHCKITVTKTPNHDFYPTNSSLSETNLYSGGQTNIQCFLNYGGESRSNVACNINAYFSADAKWDETDVKLEEYSFRLKANYLSTSNRTIKINIDAYLPSNLDSGEYYIVIKADTENEIEETNEKNNTISTKITVKDVIQDFEVESFSFEKDSCYSGSVFQSAITLKHESNRQNNTNTDFNIYLSKDTILHNDNIDSTSIYEMELTFDPYNPQKNYTLPIEIFEYADPDEYYLIAVVDEYNSINETNEENNLIYSKLKIKEAPQHDFSIENISISKDEFKPGELLTLFFDQIYYGNSFENISSNYQVYFSEDSIADDDDEKLCDYGCSSYDYSIFNPSQNRERYYRVPENTSDGKNYFIIVADHGNSIDETNEKNNTAILPVNVEEVYQDYILDSLTLNSSNIPSDNDAIVDIFCSYNGNLTTDNFMKIKLRLSKNEIWGDNDDYSLCDEYYYPKVLLGISDDKQNLSHTIHIPQDIEKGDYHILAYIDSDEEYDELSEDNNFISKDIKITGPATRDFYISNISLSDYTLHSSATVTISYTHHYKGNSLKNLGDQIGLYLSNDTLWDSSDIEIKSGNDNFDYASGNTTNPIEHNYKTIKLPKNMETGNKYLILKVDCYETQEETNEENNTSFVEINVLEEAIDLKIKKIKTNRDSVQIGGRLNVNYTGELNGFTVNDINCINDFYLSNDTILSNNDFSFNRSSVLYLDKDNSSQSKSIILYFPTNLETGEIFLLSKIDDRDKYNEINEKNNVAACPLLIQPEPVHDFYFCDAKTSKTIIQPEVNYNLIYSYCYGGNSIEDVSSYINIYLSEDSIFTPEIDRNLYRTSRFSLNASNQKAEQTLTYKIPANTTPGEYYLLLVADDKNQFDETNEENNIYKIKVTVEEIFYDFSIKSITLSADSLQKGGGVNISYEGRKISNSISNILLNCSTWISSDSVLDDNDILLDEASTYINDDENTFNIQKRYIKLPDNYDPGDYYLLVKADNDNQYNEINEGNNTAKHILKVVQPATRDFYMEDIKLLSDEIQPGTKLQFQVNHKYKGNSNDYLKPNVRFCVSKDSIWGNSDDMYIGTYNYINHNRWLTSETIARSLSVPSSILPGEYNLLIKTDYEENHLETNETNNIASEPIIINEVISDFSIQHFKLLHDSVQAGGFMHASYQIKYDGNSINKHYIYKDIVVSPDTIWGNANDVNLSPGTGNNYFNKQDTVRTYSDKLTFPRTFTPGIYYVIVRADSKNNVDETNEENNIVIQQITVLPEANHDFYLSKLTPLIDTLQAFTPIPCEVISNYNGNSISDVSTNITFYISSDSIFGNSDDIETSNYPVTSTCLNRHDKTENVSCNFLIQSQNHTGNVYVIAKTDANDSFIETDENNNTIATPVFIEEIVNDLYVSRVNVNPVQIQQAGRATISYQVEYRGNSKQELEGEINILLSKDTIWDKNSDISLCSYNCGSPKFSEEKKEYNTSIAFTNTQDITPGDYYVLVKVDDRNWIPEVNENNNVSYQKTEITDKATRDFSISNVMAYKKQVNQNGEFNVSYNIHYEGNSVDLLNVKSSCALSVNDVWGDADDIQLSMYNTIYSEMNKNKNSDKCLLKHLPIPYSTKTGEYYLLVKADTDNKHNETDESNNISKTRIEVLKRELDVYVINLSVDADTIYAGSTVNLSGHYGFSSKNESTSDIECKYYLSPNEQLGISSDILIDERTIFLNSSEPIQNQTLTIPEDISKGSYYIFAQIKPKNSNDEKNEINNIASTPVTIHRNETNDFFIDKLRAKKDTFEIGEPIDFSFDIHYSGNNQSMLQCDYSVLLSKQNMWNHNTLSRITGEININKDSSIIHIEGSFNSSYCEPGDDVYILVKANDKDMYHEENKNNNLAQTKIRVENSPALDLSIDALTIDKDSICYNSNINYSYKVKYEGQINYPFLARTYLILSENNIAGDDDDWLLDQQNITFDPATGQNTITIENNVFLGSFVSPKEYNILAHVSLYRSDDTNTENNVRSLPFTIMKQNTGDFSISNLQTGTKTIHANNYLDVKYTLHSLNNLYNFDYQKVRASFSTDTIWGNDNDIYCYLAHREYPTETDNERKEKKQIRVPDDIVPGTYYLLIKVDENNQYDEADETNNVVYSSINVLPPASNDFFISNLQITPELIQQEQKVFISGKINNKGENPDFILPTIKYYVSVNDIPEDADDLINPHILSHLNVDSLTGTFSFEVNNFAYYLNKGNYHFITLIDEQQYEDEDLSNNISSISFEIGCTPSTVHEFVYLCGDESYKGWTSEGDYERLLTSVDGCDSTVYTHLRQYHSPEKPSIKLNGECLISSVTEGNQWYFGQNIINGANDSIYCVGQKGNYAVQVTNEAGCRSEISESLFVDYTSIEKLKADMVVYPNPTSGFICFKGFPETNILPLSVFNSEGKLIKRYQLLSTEAQIDISDQPAGTYFIKLDNSYDYIFKIIKE